MFVDGNIHAVDVPTRTTTYPDGKTVTTIDVRTREDVEAIAGPLKEEGAITSVNNVSANDFALTNEVAGQLHAAHVLSANRIAGYDAEATSGSLGSGRKAIDSSYSLALYRSTPYYLQRKQATLQRISKYCGHLLQGISDASREIYVKDFGSDAAEEFNVGAEILEVGPSDYSRGIGGQNDDVVQEEVVTHEGDALSTAIAEAQKGAGPANNNVAQSVKVDQQADLGQGGQG